MDINSLLSPSESPRSTPNPPSQPHSTRSRKTRNKNAGSSLNPSLSPNSLPGPTSAAASPRHAALQLQNAANASSPTTMSPRTAARPGLTSLPSADAVRSGRQPSTPGMDALADLASMQHHQQTARVNAGGLRNADIYDNQVSAANNLPNVPTIPQSQNPPILRNPSFDRAMLDAQAPNPSPHQISSSALPEDDQSRVKELATEIAGNPFAYESHIQLINILHQGLVDQSKNGNPHTYKLLQQLQSARESMNSRFALGEDLLADWIQDQILLANNLESRIAVMEFCQKAIEEEKASTKLWLIYAQWMVFLHDQANPSDSRVPNLSDGLKKPIWSEEDRSAGRELFTWSLVMAVWEKGAEATKLRLQDSDLLWDPYTEYVLQGLGPTPSPEAVSQIHHHFHDRLLIPHTKWDQTFQTFSQFISRYSNQSYEQNMVSMQKAAQPAKQKYELRDLKEINISRAVQQNDLAAELQSYREYIDFEKSLRRKRHEFDFDLLDTLYQRALLRFPANTELWEDYVLSLDEHTSNGDRNQRLVIILEQATRHCPWSGSLWAQYLLAAEIAKFSFGDIGEIKHKATSSGLLDAGAMEELIKVHGAWCGFLRRRAFADGATDEERDVAEVGIRSAIEDMNTAGQAKYGPQYQGDPSFRLEKIYMKYFTQCRNWEAVRDIYGKLVALKGSDYNFWLRWYVWEMMTWSQLISTESIADGGRYSRPVEATKVLERALQRTDLDWPEKIIETYQYHCEDHEDAEFFQRALAQVARATSMVQERREKEAAAAYEAQVQALQQQNQVHDLDVEEGHPTTGKRKREDGGEDGPIKRSREDDLEADTVDDEVQAEPESSALKRDRENSTIVVRNLALEVPEIKIRQFFRDCGKINSLTILAEADGGTATAILELENKDDSATALTKDKKTLDGSVIDVSISAGTTIYVCNFPPTADDNWMKDKFQQFGEIVDIRFPSLKYNTHRRFCYIQFGSASQATAATTLDGQDQGDGLKLLAKISDPSHKQGRHGAMAEGRELYLANLDWGATEKELKEAFAKYGKVESARVVKKMNGKSRGFAYVVFREKESADAALEMNLSRFHGRILNVSLSTNDMAKRQATHIVRSGTASVRASDSPAPANDMTPNGVDHDSASPLTKDPDSSRSAEIQSRTVVLMNVPDTVNDSRIRALADEYGEIVKVVLRPEHQGATVEYRDKRSAGNAALGLEGREIVSERYLTVGTIGQMMQQKPEKKPSTMTTEPLKKSLPVAATPIRRPNQPGARRGGKGGLGIKGGGVGLSGPRATNDGQTTGQIGKGKEEVQENDGPSGGVATNAPKSNADFRDMLLKK